MSLNRPKVFYVNVDQIGKVYLLFYKENKIHALFDEKGNISDLKFRTDSLDEDLIKKTIEEKFEEHKLTNEICSNLYKFISANESEGEKEDTNAQTTLKKMKLEGIVKKGLVDIPEDVLNYISLGLKLYDIFALMLTSKFLYNVFKKTIFSRIPISAKRIVEAFKKSGLDYSDFKFIPIGNEEKGFFIEDIIKVEEDVKESDEFRGNFSKDFMNLLINSKENFKNLTSLNLGLVDKHSLKQIIGPVL
jgi:hypothetical protein